MFCRQCGKQIKDEIKFCPFCGTAVLAQKADGQSSPAPQAARQTPAPQATRQTPSPVGTNEKKTAPAERVPKKKRFLIPAMVCALVLLVAVGTGAAYFTGALDSLLFPASSSEPTQQAEDNEEKPETKPEKPEETPETRPKSDHPAATPAVPAPEPVEAPDSQQKIEVVCSGSTATLTLSTWAGGQWTENLSCPANIGSNGISTQKTEGDRCTPAGTYRLLFCFSTAKLDCSLPSARIQAGDVWVCDSNSRYYNTLQNTAISDRDWKSAEDMQEKFVKNRSTVCICFDFNGDCMTAGSATAYGGSALFLDGVGSQGKMTSGYGDVKISAADMTVLLDALDASKNPTMEIR